MKRKPLVWISLLGIVILLFIAGKVLAPSGRGASTSERSSSAHEETVYQCPMHPHIMQAHPGKCPICNMELQPVRKATVPLEKGKETEKKVLYYRHPMDPRISSPVPAKDDMGMPFIPVYEEGAGERTGPFVEGRAQVDISLYRQQLIGVKTEEARYQELTKTIHAYGRIAYDPGLYRVQEEYLSALASLEEAKESPIEDARVRAEKLVEALRVRLRLLGMNEGEIDALQKEKGADKNLLIAEGGGDVWLYAEIYEQELPWVKVGQKVFVQLPQEEERRHEGVVASVDPTLDPMTRTAKIRARISNADGGLKPGMYVNAVLRRDLGERLVVPRSAVLDTGKRRLVYVVTEDESFAPREIVIGYRGEDHIEIKEGVKEGEKVVVSGNFLVDAESQLRGTAGGMAFYGGREAAAPLPRHAARRNGQRRSGQAAEEPAESEARSE